MEDFDGFASIEAIFYTVFHPTEGTKVSQQVPLGSILTPQKPIAHSYIEPLFDFDLIKNYIIPKAPLCDRLITLKVGPYRLVGYPVSITAPYYARNSFSFNFCFVFKYEADTTPYESAIKRLGVMFKNLEEQYQILSTKEEDKAYFTVKQPEFKSLDQLSTSVEFGTPNFSGDHNFDKKAGIANSSTPIGVSLTAEKAITLNSIESLIQQIYQDLNNYSECLIPIDNGNSIDIKLLPLLPPPPSVNPEDVPISTVNLEKLVDVNWDPTMLKIIPFMDGINSIKRISVLIDADYYVVKTAIQHLMYYGCIIIFDIFQFSNIYAPTSNINLFLRDNHMAAECQGYVLAPSLFKKLPFDAASGPQKLNPTTSNPALRFLGAGKASKEKVILPSKAKLFSLYRSLHQGQTVKQWYKEHREDLTYIDVRKFLTFGVLRGLIYRVQSYPIIRELFEQDAEAFPDKFKHLTLNESRTYNGAGSELKTIPNRTKRPSNSAAEFQKKQKEELIKHLKNVNTFDSICTDLELDRKTVTSMLSKLGGHLNVINS